MTNLNNLCAICRKDIGKKNPAAVELGRKGGSVKSDAKKKAALLREQIKREKKQHAMSTLQQ